MVYTSVMEISWWNTFTDEQKKNLSIGGVLLTLAFFGLGFYFGHTYMYNVAEERTSQALQLQRDELMYQASTTPRELEQTNTLNSQHSNDKLETRIKNLKEEVINEKLGCANSILAEGNDYLVCENDEEKKKYIMRHCLAGWGISQIGESKELDGRMLVLPDRSGQTEEGSNEILEKWRFVLDCMPTQLPADEDVFRDWYRSYYNESKFVYGFYNIDSREIIYVEDATALSFVAGSYQNLSLNEPYFFIVNCYYACSNYRIVDLNKISNFASSSKKVAHTDTSVDRFLESGESIGNFLSLDKEIIFATQKRIVKFNYPTGTFEEIITANEGFTFIVDGGGDGGPRAYLKKINGNSFEYALYTVGQPGYENSWNHEILKFRID